MRLPTTQACRAARHLLLQRPPVLLPHRCYSSPPNQPTSPQGKPHETLEDHIRSSVPKRLADFLDRLVPSTHSVGLWHSTQRWYPAPSFLGFFPPKGDPGNVAVDGGIQSHVPAGVKLARDWEEWDRPDDPATATATGWKRLWKGGLVTFKHWLPGLTNEGTPWRCHESVHFSDEAALPSPTPTLANGSAAALPKASGTIGVDVLRNYQRPDCTGTSLAIAEVRKLVFVPGHLGPVVSSRERRIIKARGTATETYDFRPTAQDLVEFSTLTHNSHFIHLHQDRALVQGSLLLAVMLRALEQAIFSLTFSPETAVAAGNRNRDFTPTYRIREVSYTILRPSLVNQKLRVCVRRPDGEISPGDHDRDQKQTETDLTAPRRGATGVPQLVNWPVWVEAEDGGMIVKATAQIEPATIRSQTSPGPEKARRGEVDVGHSVGDERSGGNLQTSEYRVQDRKRSPRRSERQSRQNGRPDSRAINETRDAADRAFETDVRLVESLNDWEKHTI